MIKWIENPARMDWPTLVQRPAPADPLIGGVVKSILESVKAEGDGAVERFTNQFDNKQKNTQRAIDPELKRSIRIARSNIKAFHEAQIRDYDKVETTLGITCWQETRPIEKVGLYIPGGSAPLFSTILMLAVPAKLAGCKEIICCCPSDDPIIKFTADLCGVTTLHKIGGAQAIVAMAYGTKTVLKVDKIFGPGNQYVTLAKQLVQQEGVAIDMPAGPSELLIIADDTANAKFIAADLLSQAEHGEVSQVILVTTSRPLAAAVVSFLTKQLATLPREAIIVESLANSLILILNSLEEAIEFSDLYAPEHLLISCFEAEEVAKKINAAGSIFIGDFSPVAAGDYATGPNHTLPTSGYAACYSGVSLDSFQKKISFQQLTKMGLKNISKTVMTMAEAEGLQAHKKSIEIRL